MFDDLLGELFGEAVFGRLTPSRRAQLLVRVFFGLLGAGLGIAGAVHFARRPDVTSNTPMWVSMVAMFVFLASFSLFNVGLGRTWRWPGRFFLVSSVRCSWRASRSVDKHGGSSRDGSGCRSASPGPALER